jgi:hypothetical protein
MFDKAGDDSGVRGDPGSEVDELAEEAEEAALDPRLAL